MLGRPPGLPLQEEDELEDAGVMEEGELSSPAVSCAGQKGGLGSSGLQDEQMDCGSAEGVRAQKSNVCCRSISSQTTVTSASDVTFLSMFKLLLFDGFSFPPV